MVQDLPIGREFEHHIQVTPELIDAFARLSGDLNPMHTSDAYAQAKGQKARIAHGNILSMMVSTLVGMKLPSQAVILLSQSLDFRRPVFPDDSIRLVASVHSVTESMKVFELNLTFRDAAGARTASGKCLVRWMD